MATLRRPATTAALVGLGLALAGPFLLWSSGEKAAPPLTGEVRTGGHPVSGCTVRYKGDPHAVTTDALGRFRLPSPAAARITASMPGHFIAGIPADRRPRLLELKPLPDRDHASYRWVDPTPEPTDEARCGNCHPQIYREWADGAHARSLTGKHFLNLYDGTDWHGKPDVSWNLLADYPDGADVCAACHAPTSPVGTLTAAPDLRSLEGVARLGVHCDYCHKIAATGKDAPGLTHGRYDVSLLRPAAGQLFFGPLDDVDRGEDAFSPLYRDSRYCASCHEGTVFGVPVYTTYSEWRASPARAAGLHCPSCHMTPTGRMTNIAPGHGGIERDPWTLGNHTFFSGSRASMLRDAVRLQTTARRDGEGVHLHVEMRAEGVGHRVPTGFVDRHLILVAEAWDAAGRPLAVTAGPTLADAAGSELVGRAGRIYGKLLRDEDGRQPAPFWKPILAVTDTRLEPGKEEHLTFCFPATTARLQVRLLHRRFWDVVARAKRWPDNETSVHIREVRVP